MVSHRRGQVKDLYIDCGATFEGADRQLQAEWKKLLRDNPAIEEKLIREETKWHFKPQAAPHFGDLERNPKLSNQSKAKLSNQEGNPRISTDSGR